MRRPDAPEPPAALAVALARAGRYDDARVQAELAVTLASEVDEKAVADARQTAARVALAGGDSEAALAHAAAVLSAAPGLPMPAFVEGTLLATSGRDEEAAALLQEGATTLHQHDTRLEGLHLQLGNALARLERIPEAETAYRDELRAFPDSVSSYIGLAALYRSSDRGDEADAMLETLMQVVPTPDGYAAAAREWAAAGQRSRAERVRSEARARFRGDPPPARPATGRTR
jgi:tetratricopeptide (TPR) repeat protein